jgi:hypothetical protein
VCPGAHPKLSPIKDKKLNPNKDKKLNPNTDKKLNSNQDNDLNPDNYNTLARALSLSLCVSLLQKIAVVNNGPFFKKKLINGPKKL